MPRTPNYPLVVPAGIADAALQETLVRAKARKRAAATIFDPTLGASADEAAEALIAMRGDINAYGEYVYGKVPTYFHRYWNNAVDDVINRRVPQNKILIIAPPGSAKSTWETIIRSTHWIGNNPDDHLITITSSDSNAKDFDGVWSQTVEENSRFRAVFDNNPLLKPLKKRGWSSDGRFLRGIPEGDRHPTFRSVGLNASIMGARANIIIDDPMDQKTAQSETVQRTAKDYLDQTLIPRLQPDIGWMVAVMTRYHEFDLASHIIKLAQDPEGGRDWIYIRTPMIAEEKDPLGRSPGTILWPDRFSKAFVDREKRRLSLGVFGMIYQGDPTGVGGDIFKEEKWFRDLPENFWSEIFPKCRTLLCSDTAFSEKKTACFSVIMAIAFDLQFNMYVLGVWRGQVSTPKLEDRFVRTIKLVKPVVTAIEEDRFHQQLTRTMARNILKRRMCNLRLIMPDKDKVARARLPAGRAEQGMLFVDKRQPWYETFARECLAFPNSGYKDQVDTLSLGAHVLEQIEEYTTSMPPVDQPMPSIEFVA